LEKEERLDALLEAMREGEAIIGTTLTLREIAQFSGRVPPENHISSILMDLLLLIRQGKVRRLDTGTRSYKVVEDAEVEAA